MPVWTFFLLPLIVYAAWETYWYFQVGLSFIKWHTHLMLFVYLCIIGFLLIKFILQRKQPALYVNVLISFSSVIFSLFLFEAYLSISGTYKTYLEKIDGSYTSPYAALQGSYYHRWPLGKIRCLNKPEYRYCATANSLGFIDKEWQMNKKPGEKRILALGDSFTEGDGAPFDSSYVALLREKVSTHDDSYYVMNAGVCGSDPFNNYINLKDLLLKFQPDFVIQSIVSQDLITDIVLRGGMERFKKNGIVEHYPAPFWEPLYAMSYISRIFFEMAGYNQLLRKGEITSEEEQRLNRQVIELFDEYANLCAQENIKLIVIQRPERDEIENEQYLFDFTEINNYLISNEKIIFIDLLPDYLNYIKINNTSPSDYFWKYDGHHNSKGYEMMAETILNNIYAYIKTNPATKSDTNDIGVIAE